MLSEIFSEGAAGDVVVTEEEAHPVNCVMPNMQAPMTEKELTEKDPIEKELDEGKKSLEIAIV